MNELEIKKYHNPKIRRRIEISGIIISAFILIFGVFSLMFYGFYKEAITKEIFIYGKTALFFGVAFLEFIPQILSSYFPLIIAVTSGIYPLDATIISVISSLLSSVLAFEIGKKFGWKFACSLAKPKKLIKIARSWDKYGKWYVFFSAISPLPYFPIIYGSLGMSRKNMWFFGIIPRIISYIFIGYLLYLGKII